MIVAGYPVKLNDNQEEGRNGTNDICGFFSGPANPAAFICVRNASA